MIDPDPIFIFDSREAWRPVAVEESLAAHGYVWSGDGWSRDGEPADRIDLPAGLVQPADLGCAGYVRSVNAGGLVWRQYWLWWLYNPKTYAGFGAHEGDWELVQIGCADDAGERPILMTCSQHSGGEKREYWRVSLDEGRPVVYVARDSHANYFAPERDVTDVADGQGERLEAIVWQEFGAWAYWPGTWGNSENSPGPLSTRRAWTAPHAWHGQARG